MTTTPAKIQDWVIDADTHISEPGDVWTSRLPAKYKRPGARTSCATRRAGWTPGASATPRPSCPWASPPSPAGPSRSRPRRATWTRCRRRPGTRSARLAYMDCVGIWAMALYPNVGGFGSQAFLSLKDDPELMLACVRAYNDFLIDWISPDPRRFVPICATPFWDVAASVRRDRALREARPQGRALHGRAAEATACRSSRAAHWDPLWAAAQDLRSARELPHRRGHLRRRLHARALRRPMGAGRMNAVAAISLFLDNGKQLVGPALLRHAAALPGAEVPVRRESGIGFIPFILEAADYTFEYGEGAAVQPGVHAEAERVLPPPGLRLLLLRGVRAAAS